MKEKILNIIKCVIMLSLVSVLFTLSKNINEKIGSSNDANLIIYGDTISSKYKPYVENDKIYL